MYNYTCIIWYPKKDNVKSGIPDYTNKKTLRKVERILCGLTNSPTSCPWEGSAVGLEPTTHKHHASLISKFSLSVDPQAW